MKAKTTADWDEKVRLTRQYNKLATDKYAMVNWICTRYALIAKAKSMHDSGVFKINVSQWTPENA